MKFFFFKWLLSQYVKNTNTFFIFLFVVEHIMVYVASTGSLALFIMVAVVCRRRFHQLNKLQFFTKKKIQLDHVDEQDVPERHEMFNIQNNGSVYDLIEEQNMISP